MEGASHTAKRILGVPLGFPLPPYIKERGRVCLRTLVDRKRKLKLNAVDVVEHLRDPTDQAPNVRHLRVQHTFSSMTSLELLIQQSVEGEFCQHDGVVTVMVM